MYHRNNSKKGFLLVEIIVATALFVLLVALSLSAILNVLDTSKRVRANKDVMDSLNASLEYMTRIVRFGNTYHCGTSPSTVLTVAQTCTSGADLLATRFGTQTFVFSLSGGRIRVSDDGGLNYRWLTGSNVTIERLRFYTFGTDKTDNVQPYVLVVITGRVTNDPQSSAYFDIQTVMSQRKIDLNI